MKNLLWVFRKLKTNTPLTLFAIGLFALSLPNYTYGASTFFSDFASFNAATTTTLVEDFEAFTPKNTALSSFVSNGNTYTGLAGVPFPNVTVTAPGFTNYGVPVTTSSVLAANGDEDFTVDFGSLGNAVGFDTYLNSSGAATVMVFGNSGLLGTFMHNHDSGQIGFLGITADEDITRIRWTTVNGAVVNTGIDNIRQGSTSTAPIPEPSTILLFSSGLAGLIGWQYRKNQIK